MSPTPTETTSSTVSADVYRFRTRFGAEIPLVSRERAWQHRTFYAIADAEALEYTDNIFRLNIKIGLKHGVLPRLMDADADE